MTDKKVELDQERKALITEINFYYRHPGLSDDDRQAVVEQLKGVLENLKERSSK